MNAATTHRYQPQGTPGGNRAIFHGNATVTHRQCMRSLFRLCLTHLMDLGGLCLSLPGFHFVSSFSFPGFNLQHMSFTHAWCCRCSLVNDPAVRHRARGREQTSGSRAVIMSLRRLLTVSRIGLEAAHVLSRSLGHVLRGDRMRGKVATRRTRH